MPRNFKSTSVYIDEHMGAAQVMLTARLTSPYDSSDKRICTHSVLDIFFALDKFEGRKGYMPRDEAEKLAKDIAETIERVISIERFGY